MRVFPTFQGTIVVDFLTLYKGEPPCYKKWERLIDEAPHPQGGAYGALAGQGDGNGEFRRSETGEPKDPVPPISS